MKIPRQAAILIGDFETRLAPLTAETPKPLFDSGGRPFLAWILRELVRFGIEEAVLLSGPRADGLYSERPDSERLDAEPPDQFCSELSPWVPKPLACRVSTAGALWHARDQLDDTFLLINGNSWFDTNIARFFAAAAAAPDAAGCVLLRLTEDCSHYETAEVRDGRVIAFRERFSGTGRGLVGAGMYIFDKHLIERIAPASSIDKEILPLLAREGELSACVLDGFFIDVPTETPRARQDLPRRLLRPAVFFDRDGVINEDLGWVGSRDRFHWLPGAKDALRRVTDVGAHVFIVTNQSGVGRGLYTEDDVHALQQHILEDVLAIGGTIDDFRFCPYHPEAPLEPYRKESDWRKPGGGMILDLLNVWNVSAENSLLIGDKDSDIQAAEAAGIEGYLFTGGNLLEFVEPLLARLTQQNTSPADGGR